MRVTPNAVYSYVTGKIETAHTSAYVTGRYEPIPASFPAVFLREITNLHNAEAMSFSGAQGVRNSTFEAQIQSKRNDGAKEEATAIAETIKTAFAELYYILTNDAPIEDESGYYRLVLTFRRVIGAADTMPHGGIT